MEYDGRDFVGWQRQITGLSIQQVLEDAARALCSDQEVPSITAGRTDAGVHASGQVAHLDFPASLRLRAHQIRDGLNFHMKPHAVVVLRAVPVDEDWSARFSANRRSYLYRILNRPARPGLTAGQVWHVKHPLDEAAMREAAALLLGRHDFTSFRASACQAKSPLRTLDVLDVARHGELIEIRAEARSFLHHQVRNLVGTLHLVGCGRWAPARVSEALAARDRRAAGPTAPAEGLCLTAVGYDPDPFA
jgi:tRNA pseudouridine38-40 synthase